VSRGSRLTSGKKQVTHGRQYTWPLRQAHQPSTNGGHTITARSEHGIATNFCTTEQVPQHCAIELNEPSLGRHPEGWRSGHRMRLLIPIDSTTMTASCTTFSRVTSARSAVGYQLGYQDSERIIDPRHPPMHVGGSETTLCYPVRVRYEYDTSM
jgi:hypothetical protein